MRAYEAIPRLLSREGINVVFSMVGGTNVPWLADGVATGAFEFFRTRHEETAVNAAAGYARATGTVGVCTVTRGPGFANSVNALNAARHAHIPLLMIVGESPATRVQTEQNIDQAGITRLLDCGFHRVDAVGRLEEQFRAALGDAMRLAKPQVLSIADGVLGMSVELDPDAPPVTYEPMVPDPASVSAAVDVLAAARSPLIVAGQGAVLADCREQLERLGGLVAARLATTLRATQFFSGNAQNIGLCGSWAPRVVQPLLAEADVVLAVGASLSHHTTGEGHLFDGAKIIHCEIDFDQPCHATAPELALFGDAAVTTEALIAEWTRRELPPKPPAGPVPGVEEIRNSVLSVDLGHDPTRGLDLRSVYAAFDDRLPEDRVVLTDSGRTLGPLPSLVRATDARSWLIGRGNGSVGLGIGMALGAAVAHRERPVVLFCGDGGFMMAAQDLDAFRVNGLGCVIVIMNDEQYGSELPPLDKYGLPHDTVRQSLPDVELLARAFGGTATVLRDESDLEAIEFGELPDGLRLFDARLDPAIDGRHVF